MRLPPFRTWWMSIPQWIAGLVKSLGRGVRPFARAIGQTRLSLHLKPSDTLLSAGTLLRSWQGTSYRLSALPVTAVAELETASLFAHLRIIPTTHSQPLPSRPPAPYTDSTFDALLTNPYLPFWNVWKPATPWSKANWDKGSTGGIERQKPDYIIAVVE